MLLLTFGFGAVSAVIPIFNMEAYISVVYARDTAQSAWTIAASPTRSWSASQGMSGRGWG